MRQRAMLSDQTQRNLPASPPCPAMPAASQVLGDKEFLKRTRRPRFRAKLFVLGTLFILACCAIALRQRLQDYGADISRLLKRTGVQGIPQPASKNISIFDRYINAMTDFEEYRDSNYHFTPDIQKALYKHQHPRSCEKSHFLIYYVWSHGMGSYVTGLTTALTMAISTGRVLLIAAGPPPKYKRKIDIQQTWQTWHHAAGCEKEHPECFFEPISGCSLEQVHKLMEEEKISYRELPQNLNMASIPPAGGNSERVIVLRGSHFWLGEFRRNLPVREAIDHLDLPASIKNNDYFTSTNQYSRIRAWTTQTTLYAMRLNEKTRALVRSALTSCFKTDSPDLDRIIGIPIRGSDKCYRNGTRDGKPIRFGEANCVTLADTMQYATLVHSAQPWVDTVMITSEDESAIANSRFQLGSDRQKTWKTLFNDFDVHQGTGRSSAVYGKKSPDSSEKYIPAYVITQSILTTLACQALPSHHIVMMRSNFGGLIDMLAKTVPGRKASLTINSGIETYPK